MSHNSRWLVPLLLVHIVLLVLASTHFTVATVWSGDHKWTWTYFQYASSNGFGFQYASDYSLSVVLAYVAAYAVGVVAYLVAWTRGCSVIGPLGALLSAVGLISFSIEASHWLVDHHLSWILSCPLVALPLAGYAIVRTLAVRESTPPAESSAR